MPLVKRNNSKYWYVQFQLDHRTIVKSTKTTDRKVALLVESKLMAEAHAGRMLDRKKTISFQHALDRFIATKEGTPSYRNLGPRRKAALAAIPGKLSLRLVDSNYIEKLKRVSERQGLSAQTIKHQINLVMGAIRFAKREGYDTPEVYAPSIHIPNGRNRFLTKEEEGRLLKELDPARTARGLCNIDRQSDERKRTQQDNYDLVVLLLDTGARYSEIANILWTQISLGEKTIHLLRSKVGNQSNLYMTTRVEQILRRRVQSRCSPYVFSSKSGGPRGYRTIAIRKAFDRAGLQDCTIHTLRHTHASRLVQLGISIYEVQKILGHSDIRTTMRYAHLEEKMVTSKARDLTNKLNQDCLKHP